MVVSTTIRVPTELREQLRKLSDERRSTLTDTLVDALAALRREQFFGAMETWEAELRMNPQAWAEYEAEADEWGRDLHELRSTDRH